jgi:hypothetical protein
MADNIVTYKIQIDAESGKVAIDGLTKGFVKAETAAKALINTTNKLNTGLDKNINKTGLAGATVTELGRTISDSNYGIQGMANNLSQLSTLMATLISTTGGVLNGVKALGAALMGPLGIIIIIQTLLALWEGYDKAQREATKAMYDAEKASAKAASNLRVLRDVIDDNNLSLDEKQKALKKANSEYEDLNLVLDENGKLTEASTRAIDAKIEAMAREAKARAILMLIEKEYATQAEASAKDADEFLGTWDTIKATVVGIASASKTIKGLKEVYGLDEQKNVIKTSEDTVKKLTEMLKTENLVDELFKDKKSGAKTRERVFKQIFLDLAKLEEKYRQESLKADLITEEERIERAKQNAIKELEITYNTYIEKRRLKLEEFLQSNATDKSKLDAQRKFNEEVIRAEEQVASVKIALNAKVEADYKLLARKRAEIARGEAEAVIEIERQITLIKRQRSLDDIQIELDLQKKLASIADDGSKLQADHLFKVAQLEEEYRQLKLSREAEIAKFALENLSNITDFVDYEFQRQIDIEKNKTNAINNELRERLNDENLSKDERKNIQNQIAANDEALRIKQEKIERKRFIMQKAANIAKATIDTFLAANSVLAQQPGGAISKGLAMAAVIASGLLNVATIARQQFMGSANSAGAGGNGSALGSGGGIQPPDFNIVGQSPSNQLAAAVKGQFQQPVKAYVVSKDVSTAQEMDRNIIGSASLG